MSQIIDEILQPDDPYFGLDKRDFGHLRLQPWSNVSSTKGGETFTIQMIKDVFINSISTLKKGMEYGVSEIQKGSGYVYYYFKPKGSRTGAGSMLRDKFKKEYGDSYVVVPPSKSPTNKRKIATPTEPFATPATKRNISTEPLISKEIDPQELKVKTLMRQGWKPSHFEDGDMMMVTKHTTLPVFVRPDGTTYREKPKDYAIPTINEEFIYPKMKKLSIAPLTESDSNAYQPAGTWSADNNISETSDIDPVTNKNLLLSKSTPKDMPVDEAINQNPSYSTDPNNVYTIGSKWILKMQDGTKMPVKILNTPVPMPSKKNVFHYPSVQVLALKGNFQTGVYVNQLEPLNTFNMNEGETDNGLYNPGTPESAAFGKTTPSTKTPVMEKAIGKKYRMTEDQIKLVNEIKALREGMMNLGAHLPESELNQSNGFEKLKKDFPGHARQTNPPESPQYQWAQKVIAFVKSPAPEQDKVEAIQFFQNSFLGMDYDPQQSPAETVQWWLSDDNQQFISDELNGGTTDTTNSTQPQDLTKIQSPSQQVVNELGTGTYGQIYTSGVKRNDPRGEKLSGMALDRLLGKYAGQYMRVRSFKNDEVLQLGIDVRRTQNETNKRKSTGMPFASDILTLAVYDTSPKKTPYEIDVYPDGMVMLENQDTKTNEGVYVDRKTAMMIVALFETMAKATGNEEIRLNRSAIKQF